MKRTLAVLGFSLFALSANAVEIGAPFEQLNIDRALPNIDFPSVAPYVADARAPFEQLAIDRTLPNLPSEGVRYAAAAGSTASDASTGSESTESSFANQHDFIAPAQ